MRAYFNVGPRQNASFTLTETFFPNAPFTQTLTTSALGTRKIHGNFTLLKVILCTN